MKLANTRLSLRANFGRCSPFHSKKSSICLVLRRFIANRSQWAAIVPSFSFAHNISKNLISTFGYFPFVLNCFPTAVRRLGRSVRLRGK